MYNGWKMDVIWIEYGWNMDYMGGVCVILVEYGLCGWSMCYISGIWVEWIGRNEQHHKKWKN